MESRIMQVFYGNDLLPYKDKERTVHYPITGGAIAGSNNVTKIRFYVDQICGTESVSWVVVSKLPNGKLGYEPISDVQIDEELGKKYIEFDLSSYYTSVKGDLYLALRGYEGEITFEDDNDDGVYKIVGDPLIQVTGSIKLPINYSPMVNTGTQVLPTDVDRLIASLSQYLKVGDGIQIFTATNTTTFGQLFVQTGTKEFILFYGNAYYIGRFRSETSIYMETISNVERKKKLYFNNNFTSTDRVSSLFSYNNRDNVSLSTDTIWYTYGSDTTDLDYIVDNLEEEWGHDQTKPFLFKLTSSEYGYEGYYLCQAATLGRPNCSFIFRQIDGNKIFKGVVTSFPNYDLRDLFNPDYISTQTTEEYVDDQVSGVYDYVNENFLNKDDGGVVDGDVAFNGNVTVVTPTQDNHAANKGYVDDRKLDSLAISITSSTTVGSLIGTHFISYNGNLYLCSITQGGANYGYATIINLDSPTDYDDGIAFGYYTSDAVGLNATIVSILNSSNAHNIPNTDYVDNKLADFLEKEYTKVNTTTYPTLDSFLASTGEEGYIYLYPINVSDESQGYYQYIWEGSWVSLGTTQLDLSDYYTKSEADTLLNGKVDKTSSANKVYGTNDQGSQITYTVDDFYDGNIARRDSDGSITVPLTPTYNGNASSKKYVDDSVATKQDTLVSGTSIKTLNNESLLGSGNISYDNALSSSSTNAVQNKVITQNVLDLQYRVSVLEEAIVGEDTLSYTHLSESLIPTLSDNSYPIIQSGGLDTKEIKGRSFVYNQLINHGNFDSTTGWNTNVGINLTVSNNIGTLTYSSQNASANMNRVVKMVNGHKYLFVVTIKPSATTTLTKISFYDTSFAYQIAYKDFGSITANTKTLLSGIITSNRTDDNAHIIFYPSLTTSLSSGDTVQFENFMLFDLTQSGIDSATTVDEAIALLQQNGINPYEYNEYNVGTIIDSKPTTLYSRKAILPSLPLRAISRVDLGSLNWTYNSTYQVFYTYLNSGANIIKDEGSAVCSIYNTTQVYVENMQDKSLSTKGSFNKKNVIIKDLSYTNATDFKTAMSGIYLYYELETPLSQPSQDVINDLVLGTYTLDVPVLRSVETHQDNTKKQNISNLVLNGSETNWVKGSSYTYVEGFYLEGTYNNLTDSEHIRGIGIVSRGIWSQVNAFANIDELSLCFNYPSPASRLYLLIPKTENITTVEQLKTWLSNNNIEVNYVITSPIDQPSITLPEDIEIELGGSLEVLYDDGHTTPCDFTFDTAVYKPIQ